MQETVRLSLSDAETLVIEALCASRVSRANARSTAKALVAAEADGQSGHGLSRVPAYAMQARAGKVDGHAIAKLELLAPSALKIDAGFGFAYPAIDLAIAQLEVLTTQHALACALIGRSHHFGQAGAHVERLAARGLIAIMLGNTPKAMAFAGGQKAMLGTNPIAFAAPLRDAATADAPLVIDLALSVAARGKIVAAQKAGKPVPDSWAVNSAGEPTTDPSEALAGSLVPIGGNKGAALALVVEIMTAALIGCAFGWEASSMFDDRGGPPNTSQIIIGFDPQRLSQGRFAARMQDLLAVVHGQAGVRLPGTSRLTRRATAHRAGIAIPSSLHSEISALIHTTV